jgi:hypothetical protein
MPRSSASPLRRVTGLAVAAACATAIAASGAHAAEYGTGPWAKGYTDILGGIVPPQPGLYVRDDAYHYQGDADRVVFDGRVQLSVEEKYLADLLAVTYVTPFKILGGTYAVAVVPSFVQMNVKVNAGISSFKLPIGPFDPTVGPFDISALGIDLAQGDTAIAPLLLGWHSGNFWWNLGVFAFAPTGQYDKRDLANTSLNHWAEMTRFAGTYYNPETGFQVTGAAVYSVNGENSATDYTTGNILNLEGSITKNFRALGVGGVGYAMIQTTGDSGSGAKLGSFESKVYGAGPIVTYTLGAGTPTPLTLLAKWYAEFDAENTFEGNTVDVAASFKF